MDELDCWLKTTIEGDALTARANIVSGCSILIPRDDVLPRLYVLTLKGTFPDGPPYAEWQILI